MKKICNFSLLLCLFLAASMFAGCEKDNMTVGEFTATMESSNDKSYISGDPYNRHNCWNSTDIIYVNAQPVKEFRLDMEEWKAIFKPAEHADSYRMFTYGGEAFTWSGNVVNFSLSETYDGQDMPMWATAGDFGPVVFHNLFSVIHFTGLDAYATGTPITVTTQNTNISGSFSYNFATGNLSRGTGSKQRVITVSGSEAWMVIPTIPNETFTVRIGTIGTSGVNGSDLEFKTRAIPANMVLNCAAFSNKGDFVNVSTAQQLENALKNQSVTKIRLTKDIDFSGKGNLIDLIIAIGGHNWIRPFELDGNGYNITIDRPIYYTLYSPVSIADLSLSGTLSYYTEHDGAFANAYSIWDVITGSVKSVGCNSSVVWNNSRFGSGTSPVPFTK